MVLSQVWLGVSGQGISVQGVLSLITMWNHPFWMCQFQMRGQRLDSKKCQGSMKSLWVRLVSMLYLLLVRIFYILVLMITVWNHSPIFLVLFQHYHGICEQNTSSGAALIQTKRNVPSEIQRLGNRRNHHSLGGTGPTDKQVVQCTLHCTLYLNLDAASLVIASCK